MQLKLKFNQLKFFIYILSNNKIYKKIIEYNI